MISSGATIKSILCKNIDQQATVGFFGAADSLSPFLSGAFDLYMARVFNQSLVVAEPIDGNEDITSLLKRGVLLQEALGKRVVLFLGSVSPAQRRRLIGAGQGFISQGGDVFLPSLSLILGSLASPAVLGHQAFTPSQQAIFLFCLYGKTDVIRQIDVQNALNLSAGSVSLALSLFVELRMLDYAIGGKTGRQRNYMIESKADFYRIGIGYFGQPVRERVRVALALRQSDWLLSGVSALAARSDLIAPKQPIFAIAPAGVEQFLRKDCDTETYGELQILRYNPAPFAVDACVDPVTMALTLNADDERISLALRAAMKGYPWYQE